MSLAPDGRLPDWEAFYRDYRKPDYVPGFEITTKLGGGMFGLVFRARRMSIGKDYAIKFLQVDDSEVRKAVVSELEQVKWFAQIDHPNLVSIEDRGEVDGIPYLVMAFAGTETLRDKITGEPPSPEAKDELLRWFLQCCRGLAALHERSLVHFDIKPANVFLKGSVARLGDYGLSKLVTHSRGSLSMGRGTPYYMAPEMLQRRGDHRSDIYSLGVMLYELLCGKVPFTGDSEWEVLKKHETEPPAMPACLTAPERAILQRCLQKDPVARFQSVHDLVAAFEAPGRAVGGARSHDAVIVGDCVPTNPPAAAAAARDVVRATRRPSEPPPLPVRRHRRGLGLASVVAVFALVVVVYSVRRATAGPTFVAQSSPSPQPPVTYSAPRAAATPRPQPAATTNAKVDQLVAGALKAARTAVQRERRTDLKEIDPDFYAMPRDFKVYREQLRELGKAPAYAPVQAQRLERLGRPGFVAGVALLHEFDYEEVDDCARATNIMRFLGQLTGIAGLEATCTGTDPCASDVCRFLAMVDAWRKIAEQFARTEVAFQQLLAAKGKGQR